MGINRYIKQLGGETAIYGLSVVIGQSINVFLVPLYTRVFSPAEYGIVAIISSLVSLASALIVLGLDSASARFFYDNDDTIRRKKVMSSWFWCQMVVGGAVVAAIVLLAAPLATYVLNSRSQVALLILAGLAIPFRTFNKVLGNWLRYQRRAWLTLTYSIISTLVMIGFIIIFVLFWRKGLQGLYWAQLLAAMCLAIVAAVILKEWIAPWYISTKILKEMLVFGLPLVPAAIATWITTSANRFILQLFHDSSEVGLYAIAFSVAFIIGLVTNAFQMAWGPFAFSIHQEPDSLRIYSRVFSLYGFFGCWLGLVLSLFAPLVLKVFTTPQYFAAASSVPYLAFSFLAMGAFYIAAIGSNIAKKSVPVAVSIFIGAGVNIVLNFALIPWLGKEGAAISTLVAYLGAVAYLFYASQKHYPIPYRFKDVAHCLGFAWLLIGLDYFLLPRLCTGLATWGAATFAIRCGMCLLFIPWAFWVGIVKPEQVRGLFTHSDQRSQVISN